MRESLDRYITREPDGHFDEWCELVGNKLDDVFWYENEDWLNEYDGQYNKWLNSLFTKGKENGAEAARIIERAHRMFIKRKDNDVGS